MLRKLKSLVPPSIKWGVRASIGALLDMVDEGKRGNRLVPPRRMSYVGGGWSAEAYLELGRTSLEHFRKYGDITPDSTILDIGCGTGRMAVPLTGFLSPEGRYVGFDIVPSGIDWCTKHISTRHPNFTFIHSPIHNRNYNPGGTVQPADYPFPVDDDSIDFAFATSVFTHMLPTDLNHYLSEVARALKPGGKALMTFFLLNDRSIAAIEAMHSKINFSERCGDYWTYDRRNPESSLAYFEDAIVGKCSKLGLQPCSPIIHGAWSGAPEAIGFQDYVIVEKIG